MFSIIMHHDNDGDGVNHYDGCDESKNNDLEVNSTMGSLQNSFLEKVGHSAQQGGGGGLTEAQVFVEIFQNQICLGKWPEM